MRACPLLVIALLACSSKPPPAPIENTAKPQPGETASPEPGLAIGMSRITTKGVAIGGIIELRGDRARAMAGAAEQMSAHCGADAYTIVQEGEEAIGGGTAWRVHYQCNR